MKVCRADERDAREEMVADGYRVTLIKPGRRVGAFDVDAASFAEALSLAGRES